MRKAASSPYLKSLARAARVVKAGRTFFLAGHRNPDGDTLGSALALASLLKGMGKSAQVFAADPPPDTLDFLPGIRKARIGRPADPDKRFDVAVLFECSSPDRIGGLIDLKTQAGTVIHIDHHRTSEPYGDINLIDPESSSTSEQVYGLFQALGKKPNSDEATCLYVGMVTDTGRFHYPATSPSTHRTAAELMERGARTADANDRIFATKVYPALKILGHCLSGLSLELGGKAAIQVISRRDFARHAARPEHSEDVVNYGLMVPGVWVSALFKEALGRRPGLGRISVSLRSRGKVDVSRLAQGFGGGGHRNAAGFHTQQSLPAARGRFLKRLKSLLP